MTHALGALSDACALGVCAEPECLACVVVRERLREHHTTINKTIANAITVSVTHSDQLLSLPCTTHAQWGWERSLHFRDLWQCHGARNTRNVTGNGGKAE